MLRLTLVPSLTSVTVTPARTAPVGSETRPTMRPVVPCAKSRLEVERHIATARQTREQRARSDGMEPPGTLREVGFSMKATACVQLQPCYNPVRLEKADAHCQEEKTHSVRKEGTL